MEAEDVARGLVSGESLEGGDWRTLRWDYTLS